MKRLTLVIGCAIALLYSCGAKSALADINLKASWYSTQSLKDEGTFNYSKGVMANGEKFNEKALTCATRLYPLGTFLVVTNTGNNLRVVVKVTDRIGRRFAKKRIDLSKAAFQKISRLERGIVPIKVEVAHGK